MLSMDPAVRAGLPPWSEIIEYLRGIDIGAVHVLRDAVDRGRPAIQPRCGVGGHAEMTALLRALELGGRPDLLTVTVDSHTRLRDFATAARALRERPAELNGYPMVTHGWARGRELVASVGVPLQVRHGSPDPRELFATALASGITSFEGGGISYNLPYAKDVPLEVSLHAWQEVDAVCGELHRAGVVIDREFFGTLTAVLMPPAISIAVALLEAICAARAGVTCLSIAYPQGGNACQDVAALQAIASLAERYLPDDACVFPVLHQFMGVFPRSAEAAEALILLGGIVGRLGGAAKVITKTVQEAHGIPTAEANLRGLRTTALAQSDMFAFVRLDDSRVAEERHWIEREVAELIEPLLDRPDLHAGICEAFRVGRLDVPFSASIHARSEVVPGRDAFGAIRFVDPAQLALSAETRRRHNRLLATSPSTLRGDTLRKILNDINHFVAYDALAGP